MSCVDAKIDWAVDNRNNGTQLFNVAVDLLLWHSGYSTDSWKLSIGVMGPCVEEGVSSSELTEEANLVLDALSSCADLSAIAEGNSHA